jgi:hypothetical protein
LFFGDLRSDTIQDAPAEVIQFLLQLLDTGLQFRRNVVAAFLDLLPGLGKLPG